MSLKVRPLNQIFAGEASGVDLRKPLELAAADEIRAAMDLFAVLVFRDQPLTPDQQIAFARSLGPLDGGLNRILKRKGRFGYEELQDISNVGENGEVLNRDHPRVTSGLADQLWHADSSFKNPPGEYSMLLAMVVPDHGGESEYVDMRAGYDILADETKKQIDALVAEHYVFHSRMMLGNQYPEEQQRAMPPVRWPVVRVNPRSKRKSLYIGAHATRIVDWSLAEGRLLLLDLLERATNPLFIYKHHWRPGDLVICDNRSTLHRGRPFDLSQRRELRRVTTEEGAPKV